MIPDYWVHKVSSVMKPRSLIQLVSVRLFIFFFFILVVLHLIFSVLKLYASKTVKLEKYNGLSC